MYATALQQNIMLHEGKRIFKFKDGGVATQVNQSWKGELINLNNVTVGTARQAVQS